MYFYFKLKKSIDFSTIVEKVQEMNIDKLSLFSHSNPNIWKEIFVKKKNTLMMLSKLPQKIMKMDYTIIQQLQTYIKHPLFLALKFSKCITIYYLKTMITDNYLVEFQKQLKQKQGNSEYIIAFQSNNNRIRKKIEESLTQLFIQSSVRVLEKKCVDETLYSKLEYDIKSYDVSYPKIIEIMNSSNSETQMDIQIEEQNQQQVNTQCEIIRQQPNGERKSAFKKFNKDFDKMPTKNFQDFQNCNIEDNIIDQIYFYFFFYYQLKQYLFIKLIYKQQIIYYIQKKVKLEDDDGNNGNQMLPFNIQNILFQEQLMKYYLLQQYIRNLLSQQI